MPSSSGFKQPFSKIVGHANAAVRCSVPWQGATVERDARPSEALHVGHVRVIVHVGVVLGFLLDNAEDPCWRLATLLPTRHRCSYDPALIVIDRDLLVVQRNDCHYWFVSRARLYELCISVFYSAYWIGRRYQSGQPGEGQAEPSPVVVGLEETRFHARIGPRPPDRIHNTISLRRFPWDGQQKDGRRFPSMTRSIYGFGRSKGWAK